ncbi:polyisoprenoid-binding protein YceI [Arcticibacter tournemirensis]|uniref:YceI family protein n=1 Tax=Arcticibacter tournemirensis TaxID=699437 RepID=A0A4Q0M5U0_9SPHI|nr:YceI family protein [Arcticibacter tournemirensis]KAA8482599.1 YceI family protein [Arcticibacter tournemirensis]RXF68391.1 YceI family protein [Arcticibacter tournemirensis]TQM52574.1 polyisoprenoid-binding protein YceI [Arcticibacter tournemirensis]
MKIKTLFAAVAILAFAAFKPALKTETFTIDTKNSSIEWVAAKVTGKHNGTVKISSGNLVFNGKSLQGGSFTTDMNSIAVVDLQGESAQKLIGHLRSDDFFSVEKHPTSEFRITKVSPAGTDQVNITGDLTIKGITQPITFPAIVKRQGNAVVAVAKGVKVDRTKYDIKYGSKSFFGGIGDKAIDDEFTLSINLAGKK